MTFSNLFFPASKIITAITKANPGVVTTSTNHGYSNGLYVRLIIPIPDGMQQAAGNVYLITVLSPTTFSIGIDTRSFDSFAVISTTQPPQVIPVGEVSNTLVNAEINSTDIIPET